MGYIIEALPPKRWFSRSTQDSLDPNRTSISTSKRFTIKHQLSKLTLRAIPSSSDLNPSSTTNIQLIIKTQNSSRSVRISDILIFVFHLHSFLTLGLQDQNAGTSRYSGIDRLSGSREQPSHSDRNRPIHHEAKVRVQHHRKQWRRI